MKKLILLLMFLPVILFAQEIIPIAEIQDNISDYDGETVTIQGIITIGVGITHGSRVNVFIQDDSNRGLMLFDYDITQAYEEDLIRGNELEVTGEVDEYNGITELKDFSYEVVSENNFDPAPVNITIGANNDHLEGTLVQVSGTIYDIYSGGGGTNLNIQDDSGNSVALRVWDSTGIDISEFYEGYVFSQARGVGSIYNNYFQILPGYQDHLITEVPYVIADGEEILPNTPIKVAFEYQIDFEEVNILWKTNSEIVFNQLSMDIVEERMTQAEASLPAQEEGTSIEFYFVAVDTVATDTVSTIYYFPEGYPANTYSLFVPVSSHEAILNIPPKPFNPYAGETFPIEFASKDGDKAILRLYNAEGKLVFTPKNLIINISSGIVHYDWNGRDKNNKLLPLGLYICYLEVVDKASGKKKTAKAPIVIGAPLK